MITYIGTKLIKAEKMMAGEYRKIGFINANMYDDTEGYKVQYEDGYISWSPADVFERAYKKINGEFVFVATDLLNREYTSIFRDENIFKAPYNYLIQDKHTEKILTGIHFQEGSIMENGVNGIFMGDLISICIDRLEEFQKTEFKCHENEEAKRCLMDSLKWLNSRTKDRKNRNVLGTNTI
jgi:hypothetical protein